MDYTNNKVEIFQQIEKQSKIINTLYQIIDDIKNNGHLRDSLTNELIEIGKVDLIEFIKGQPQQLIVKALEKVVQEEENVLKTINKQLG